jgi:hypothetical protein
MPTDVPPLILESRQLGDQELHSIATYSRDPKRREVAAMVLAERAEAHARANPEPGSLGAKIIFDFNEQQAALARRAEFQEKMRAEAEAKADAKAAAEAKQEREYLATLPEHERQAYKELKVEQAKERLRAKDPYTRKLRELGGQL